MKKHQLALTSFHGRGDRNLVSSGFVSTRSPSSRSEELKWELYSSLSSLGDRTYGSHPASRYNKTPSREWDGVLWQGRQDSNLRPKVLETSTLPAELLPYAGRIVPYFRTFVKIRALLYLYTYT